MSDLPGDLPLVRVRLKYPDVDTFAERFSPNVTRGGIFLASREPRPVGTLLRFEVSLMSGMPVLTGQGRVTWTKAFDPKEPGRPYGMGVQFTELDPSSKNVLDRLLLRRDPGRAQVALGRSPAPTVERGRTETAKTQPMKRPSTGARPPPLPPEVALQDRLDDAALARLVARARALATEVEDVEDLARPSNEPPPTLAQALAELPRYLGLRSNSDPVH